MNPDVLSATSLVTRRLTALIEEEVVEGENAKEEIAIREALEEDLDHQKEIAEQDNRVLEAIHLTKESAAQSHHVEIEVSQNLQDADQYPMEKK